MLHREWREPRSSVDECRRRYEHGGDDETGRDRDLEPREILADENAGRADRVQRQEGTRREKSHRQEEHPGITPPVGGLTRRVRERDNRQANRQEDHEVNAMVVPSRIEMRAQQQRDETDERQRRGQRPSCAQRDPRPTHSLTSSTKR